MQNRLPLYIIIGVSLPFAAMSAAVPLHLLPNTHLLVEMLLTYAAIIVSFLGGIHCGFAVTQYASNHKIANLLMAESIVPSLIAWSILFFPDIHIQLLVFAVLYPFMWAVDSLIFSRNIVPEWFFDLRCIVTPIVVVSLYVAYFGLV